jgi:transposase
VSSSRASSWLCSPPKPASRRPTRKRPPPTRSRTTDEFRRWKSGSREPAARAEVPAATSETRAHRARSGGARHCAACGEDLRRIGEEISEHYEYIPAQMKVIEAVTGDWTVHFTGSDILGLTGFVNARRPAARGSAVEPAKRVARRSSRQPDSTAAPRSQCPGQCRFWRIARRRRREPMPFAGASLASWLPSITKDATTLRRPFATSVQATFRSLQFLPRPGDVPLQD